MILGDNVFFGEGMGVLLGSAMLGQGAVGFCTRVTDGKVISLQEKPLTPLSDWAMTGLYVVDGDAAERGGHASPLGAGRGGDG